MGSLGEGTPFIPWGLQRLTPDQDRSKIKPFSFCDTPLGNGHGLTSAQLNPGQGSFSAEIFDVVLCAPYTGTATLQEHPAVKLREGSPAKKYG